MTEFQAFPKTARLNREIIITEKIDGTNAQICITDEGEFLVGSKNRWITPEHDNYGFARWAWAQENKAELLKLGPGRHFGEWWGNGIQRGYDQKKKYFSLFNVSRWTPVNCPDCCLVVPVLYQGVFSAEEIRDALDILKVNGSWAAPHFMQPEGIVIYHTAAKTSFKVTLENDEQPKGCVES